MNHNTKYEIVALQMKVDLATHDISLEELVTLYNRLLEENGKRQQKIKNLVSENRDLTYFRDYWYKKATGADWSFNATDPINWD